MSEQLVLRCHLEECTLQLDNMPKDGELTYAASQNRECTLNDWSLCSLHLDVE